MNKRSLPEIRKRMHELANELGSDELHDLAEETWRTTLVPRAKRKSRKMTAELRDVILDHYTHRFDNEHLKDIGRAHGVDGGRVSEVIAGKYDHLDYDHEALG